MSFTSLLRHNLVVERATPGAVDDWNQPSRAWATFATVRGLVQPKSAKAIAQANEAGASAATHRIFLPVLAITTNDRIRFEPADGRYFQIDSIDDAGGQDHHLELDAHLVKPQVAV